MGLEWEKEVGIGVQTVKALELEWGLSKHWNRPPKVWATPLVHFSDIILPGSLPGIISYQYYIMPFLHVRQKLNMLNWPE